MAGTIDVVGEYKTSPIDIVGEYTTVIDLIGERHRGSR
jgi:hypothetical protein